MKLSWGSCLVGATFVMAGVLSCSSDKHSESVAHSSEALSATDRVLSFEQPAADWTPTDATIASADAHVDGAHSGAFTVTGWNAQLVSPRLAPLGPIASTATLEFELPANLAGQSWQGQISLVADAPSAGIYSQHTTPVQFQSAPVGSFQHIQFTLAPAVVSALSAATAADLQFTLVFGMAPNSQPFLVDKLNFGQASQPDGGTVSGSGASTGMGGAAGTAGAGAAGGGLSSGGGNNVAGTSGASSGTAGGGATTGTSGPCSFSAAVSGGPVTDVNFVIKLPHGVHREDIGIAATGGVLTLDDGVRLVKDSGGFASVSSVGAINRTSLGVGAEVQDVYSEPTGVDLRSNAHVHGALKTAADLSEQAGAVVDGASLQNTSLQPLDEIDWQVGFPIVNRGSCSVEPDNTETIDPGSYGDVAIKSRSHLRVRSGTYFFRTLSLEPQAVLDIDNTAGPVFIYVQGSFAFSGIVAEVNAAQMNFLFGVAGANDIAVQSAFRGILVAPFAGITLPSEGTIGHVGAFFGRSVTLHQATTIHQEPLLPAEFCDTAAECSSFCPCGTGKSCSTDSQCNTGLGCSNGTCACARSCVGKQCGDDPSDGCGGVCPGLCQNGQAGCTSDAECPSGSVCGFGIGGRFGLASGTNACWPTACKVQNPSQPNCGVDPQQCGVCPACTPQCAAGSTGPNGCGGFCGECSDGEARLPNGECALQALANVFTFEAPSTYPIPLLTTSTEQAGATPAAFAVSDRGTASYSIPIQVPPGRLGMHPTLSLNYASTKNNGMLGMGWSLGGLSTISRCPAITDRPDFANEDLARPVTFNAHDWFCLDGHALVVTPGHVYGSDGAEYRTEIDTFVKVISHGGGTFLGPQSFEVFTKDGRVLTYGGTSDSSVFVGVGGLDTGVKRIWALNLVSDRSGNTMSVTYEPHVVIGAEGAHLNETGELLPAQIAYGANGANLLSDSRFVKFSYEARPDPRDAYVSGVEAVSSQRLRAIDTFAGADSIRTYFVSYNDGHSGGESLASSVTECGYDGPARRCLPSTSFRYNPLEAQTPLQVVVPAGYQGGPEPGPGEFIAPITLDVDGDGRDDLLVPTDAGNRNRFDFNWFLSKPASNTATGNLFPVVSACISEASVVDLNRDGKDDLISACGREEIDTFSNDGFHVPTGSAFAYISNGSGFAPQNLGFNFTGELKFADVNGDGLRDIVVCQDVVGPDVPGHDCEPDSLSIKDILLNTGSLHFDDLAADAGNFTAAFDPPPPNGPIGPGLCRNLVPLDVNGDGREELLQLQDPAGTPHGSTDEFHACPNPPPATGPRFSVLDPILHIWTDFGPSAGNDLNLHPIFKFADVNGDGLKDILYAADVTGSVNLAINRGKRFVSSPLAPGLLSGDELKHALTLDYDGDGREDLVTNAAFLRLGSQRVAIANPVNPLPGGSPFATVADVDGDGSPDLVPEDLNVPIALAGHSASAGLLERIDDGNGKETNITYDLGGVGPKPSSPTYTVADCTDDAKTTCVRRVAPLVSGHAESQRRLITTQSDHGPFNIPVFNPGPSFTYQYSSARVGLRGRGWFGFGGRTVTLQSLWKVTFKYLNSDFFLAGHPSSIERDFIDQTPANSFMNAASHDDVALFTWTSEPGDFQPFPFVTTEEHRVHEGTKAFSLDFVTTDRTPDTYGNVITETSQTALTNIATVREVTNDPSQWLIGQVNTSTTTSRRAATETQVRAEEYTYYPSTNLVHTASRLTNDATAQRTVTFSRNPLGSITSTCFADAKDLERCSGTNEFDDQLMFPKSVFDPEGLESTVQYSAADGQLMWVQDSNGIISEFVHDAFGRPKHIVTPKEDTSYDYFNVQNDDDFNLNAPFGASSQWSALGMRKISVGRGTSWQSFDAFGRVVLSGAPSFGDGNEILVEHQYDALGRLVSEGLPHLPGDSSQGKTQYSYDAFGRMDEQIFADGRSTLMIYPTRDDAIGTFTSLFSSGLEDDNTTAVVVIRPDNKLDARVLDADGYVSRTVQSPGPAGSGTEFAAGTTAITNFRRTGFGMLTQIDATVDGSVTAHTIIAPDPFGRTLTLDDPSLGHQVNTYNGFDEVVSHTDGKGQVTVSTRDTKGRPLEVDDSDGAVLEKWVYGQSTPNERGRLIAAYRQSAPGSGTGNWVRYNYQSEPSSGVNRGLLESTSYGLGGVPSDIESGERFNVGLEYKSTVPWQVDVVHYPDAGGGFAVQYNYDSTGVISSVQPPASVGIPNPTPYWQLRGTSSGFRPSDEVFGNGDETIRTYYSLNDVQTHCQIGLACMPGSTRKIVTQQAAPQGGNQSVEPIQDIDYAYDQMGNVLDVLSPTGSSSYGYDQFDRLNSEEEDSGSAVLNSVNYTMSLGGNITHRSDIGDYQYNNANRPYQVSLAGDTSYTYDDNGNQTDRVGTLAKGGRQHLDYDLFDMPRRVTTGVTGSALTTELQYDGNGARVLKRELAGEVTDADSTSCAHNPAACVSQQTIDIGEFYEQVSHFAARTCDRSSVLDPNSPQACAATERIHSYRIYAGTRQVAQVQRVEHSPGIFDPDQTHYLHDDRLGSTSIVTGATGAVEEQRRYTAFGELRDDNFSSTGVLSGFAGLEHDQDLGLVNMRGRLYDPHLARFVSADPFVAQPYNTQGLNRYSYAGNNPLSVVDPSGFDGEGEGEDAPPAPEGGGPGGEGPGNEGDHGGSYSPGQYGTSIGSSFSPGSDGVPSNGYAYSYTDLGDEMSQQYGPYAPGTYVFFWYAPGTYSPPQGEGAVPSTTPQQTDAANAGQAGNWSAGSNGGGSPGGGNGGGAGSGTAGASGSHFGGGSALAVAASVAVVGAVIILSDGTALAALAEAPAALTPQLAGAGAVLATGAAAEAPELENAGAALADDLNAAGDAAEQVLKEPTDLHHVFPQDLSDEFEKIGISIHDFTMRLPQSVHSAIHAGGWNADWVDFIHGPESYPTISECQNFATEMIYEYQIDGYLPMVPYR